MGRESYRGDRAWTQNRGMSRDPGAYAHFKTNHGDFVVRLFEADAPKTVANFTGLAEGTKAWKDPVTGESITRPFFNGLTFHRIIDGFMIQGGCPLGTGTGGPGYRFEDEFQPGLRHSRAGHPLDGQRRPQHQRQPVLHHPRADAASRQPPLGVRRGRRRASTWSRRSAKLPTGRQDKPVEPVTIETVTIERV